jgi:hypothetical protein
MNKNIPLKKRQCILNYEPLPNAFNIPTYVKIPKFYSPFEFYLTTVGTKRKIIN